MSYIDCYRKGDNIVVWERVDGQRIMKEEPAPYHLYVPDKTGEHKSIYGDTLHKFSFDSKDDFTQTRKALRKKYTLFESDVHAEFRYLSQNYYQKEPPKLHTSYLDIEVDYDPEIGFASSDDPYAPINSVAIFNDWENRMILFAVPPTAEWYSVDTDEILDRMNKVAELPDDIQIEVKMCGSEMELLNLFLESVFDADVLSGWNSRFFDLPYIAARLEMLSKNFLRRLTFRGAPTPRWGEQERMGRTTKVIELVGRVSLDYLEIFKKFEVSERPSFKLESIAEEVLPEMPKLEYEGSLADLYRKDFIWFIRYNLRDTEILRGFEQKKGYIDLANRFVHDSTAQFKHLLGTLKMAEFSILNYCHHEKNVVAFDRKSTGIAAEDMEQFGGAFVLDPVIGLHDWIGSVDINSLYPSSIRAINISPEKIIGQFRRDEEDAKHIAENDDTELTLVFEDGDSKEKPAHEWRRLLITNKWSVSGYGTVFNQDKKGIVPSILEQWYADRKSYQRNKGDAKGRMKSILEKYKKK